MDSIRIATLSKGPFDVVSIRAGDDLEGRKGRSKTRNDLAAESEADWLFFLDADDLMHPKALEVMTDCLNYDAVFGQIVEMKDGVVAERYQVPEIPGYKELIAFAPTMTLQMGHFVKRDVFLDVPFKEDMDTGEDWDYYLRLWKTFSCTKLDKPLMINRRGMNSGGPRSATGVEWTRVVDMMLETARAN